MEATKEAIYLRDFLSELGFQQKQPTPIFVDNTSTIKLAQHSTLHTRSKHIDVRYFYTRELIANKKITVSHIPTTEQRADILTKALHRGPHEEMKKLMNMTSLPMEKSPAKTNYSLFSSVLMTLLMTMTVFSPSLCISSYSKTPVLWRKASTPVVSGYLQYELDIVMVDPCEMLDSSIIHHDLLDQAIGECQTAYEQDFLHSLSEMCPVRKDAQRALQKRAVPLLLLGGLVLGGVAIAGAGIAGLVVSLKNAGRISDLEDSYDSLTAAIKQLERNQLTMDQLIEETRAKFNNSILRFEHHERDYNELKYKSVLQAYAISRLVSRLQIGNSILSEAKREWSSGKLHMPLMDFLNFTLPCGPLCAFKYAKAEGCEFDHLRNKLYMTIDIPIINNKFMLLTADPFSLMKRIGNQTCTLQYQGPPQSIISNTSECVHPLLSPYVAQQELLIYPVEECQQDDINNRQFKAYTTTKCEDTRPNDHLSFIQLKREANFIYIYCPLSNITIGSKVQPCPDSVFTLPFNTDFAINNIRYNGSIVRVKAQEMWAPLWTSKANWYLFQDNDMEDLLLSNKTLSADDLTFEELPKLQHDSGYSLHSFLAIVVFGLLFIILLAVRHYSKSKNGNSRIIVEARPLNDSTDSQI